MKKRKMVIWVLLDKESRMPVGCIEDSCFYFKGDALECKKRSDILVKFIEADRGHK